MEKLNKYTGLFMVLILAGLALMFVIPSGDESLVKLAEKRALELEEARVKLHNVTRVNDSLVKTISEYDSTITKSLNTIENLTKPKVTDETVKEALEWIYEYNLQH